MSGNKVLLDSNILIYLSKGQLEFTGIQEKYDRFYISIITYMEVLGYDFKNEPELKLIAGFLNKFNIAELNMDIAMEVISIRKKKKIKLPDAVIIATANYLECDLLTENKKDFKSIYKNLKIIKPNLLL